MEDTIFTSESCMDTIFTSSYGGSVFPVGLRDGLAYPALNSTFLRLFISHFSVSQSERCWWTAEHEHIYCMKHSNTGVVKQMLQ